MEYRQLGPSDLNVSVICFGPMRCASREPGEDERSKKGEQALRHALDLGINFLHSSYEYGTRWMMARVLKDHPKRTEIHHVIKVPVPDAMDQDRFDESKFRMRIEQALRELHADRISVIQWMWRSSPNEDARRLPLLAQIIDDVTAAFERLRDEGKVSLLMTFPYTVACGRAAIATGRFSGLIAPYNLLETEFADLFDELTQRQMGFIPFRPLYQGLLTDQRAVQSSLARSDRCAEPAYTAAYERLRAIQATFAEDIGPSMTSFAIRFTLAHPAVASLVVGMNSIDQVNGVIKALDQKIPSQDIVERVRKIASTESALPEPPHARKPKR